MKFPVKNIQFITAFLALAAVYVGCTKGPDIKSYSYPAPEPKTVFPDTGYAGFATVTITGTQFGDYKDAVKVFFGGIQADTILSCQDSTIVARVPKGAVTGKVSLQVWTHTVDSIGEFRVVEDPVITKASKDIGFPGDAVEISGKGFGSDLTKLKVTFNGTEASITDVNDTAVHVTLPVGFSSGNIVVSVNGFRVTGPGFRAFATVPDPIYWLSFEGKLTDNMGGGDALYSFKDLGKQIGWGTGVSGQAVKFEGAYNSPTTNNQYLSLPGGLTKQPELTVSCWVWWTNDESLWTQEPIFDAGLARGNRISLYTRMSSGFGTNMVSRIAFEKKGPSDPNTGGVIAYTATGTPLGKKDWHHVAMVVSQANKIQQIYLDGVLAGTGTLPALADHTIYDHSKVYIGAPIGGSVREPSFGGMVDEFQIFNQALNADQIYAVYYKHKPTK
jgi:hypothetical protein